MHVCDGVGVKGHVCVCVHVSHTHMPAVERLLGNPSKKDLEPVGSRAGPWGAGGDAEGEER